MAAVVTYSPKQANPGPAVGTNPWLAIKAPPGSSWNASNYNDSASPSSDLRGGAGSWTFGVVHLVRRHYLVAGSPDAYLWDAGISGTSGHQAYWDAAGSDQSGKLIAAVGSTASTFPYQSGSNSTFTPDEQNISGDIQITAIAVDPGTSFPSNDRFWVNGRPHFAGPGITSGWESTSAGPGPFRLGTDVSESFATEDWIIGMFLHLGTLTDEELFILRKNIETAKKISGADVIGGGVVLDHIWDVKGVMTVGSASSPATWVSTGAIGGISLARSGVAHDVVEIQASVGIR